ncbi:hypothetical protein PGTUg99_004957 [Puccinia graminis f. sp. tritici]|uniref:Uncharacterized protein n=3 Tax=Puccinia graminis f. sp. tritici TaxID=56615 RepID=E3KN38_PUCGT|nr:uncharacterized protein PGTG_11003 [Puccinia graminis f. sp. tritici CRL 75-36-700-3]EFP85674.2 hypothetical protein PGTG_11003 [Puccinia graminis f. sp. tritici CRL 75-36-700-3]KAA1100271.1 hypothetical protein PGTUg99_004957 [Puccinia graminis f. sp. tritici]
MHDGGCGKHIERDAEGKPIKWQLVKAHRTEKHPGYFNCLGTDAAFSTCCLPHKLPKDGTLTLMNKKNDPQAYDNLCRDSKPDRIAMQLEGCSP